MPLHYFTFYFYLIIFTFTYFFLVSLHFNFFPFSFYLAQAVLLFNMNGTTCNLKVLLTGNEHRGQKEILL